MTDLRNVTIPTKLLKIFLVADKYSDLIGIHNIDMNLYKITSN